MTFEELVRALSAGTSQEELLQTAQAQTQAEYESKRLSAKQNYETSDAALARELTSLRESYANQLAQSESDYRQAASQADRTALSRGMQRSSYTNATLANIALNGEAAAQNLRTAQAQAESENQQKRTLLATQYGETQQSLNASQAADVQKNLAELKTQAATESQNRSALLMKLYEYSAQARQSAQEESRWLAEYQAKYKKTPNLQTDSGSVTLSDLIRALGYTGA